MTFRSLGSAIKRRERTHVQTHDSLAKVARTLSKFSQQEMGISAETLGLDYSLRGDILTIRAPSKSIANELSMRLSEIARYIHEDELSISRIVIQ